MKKLNARGFANVIGILIVLIVLIIAGIVFWRVNMAPNQKSGVLPDTFSNKRNVGFTPLDNLDESPYKDCNYDKKECVEPQHSVKGRKIFIFFGAGANVSGNFTVTKVEETDKALLVHVEEITAGDGCGILTVINYPSAAIELNEDIKKPVEITKTTKKSARCG
jgi:hypothetical protein